MMPIDYIVQYHSTNHSGFQVVFVGESETPKPSPGIRHRSSVGTALGWSGSLVGA
jgi:hypothetical protein